MTVRDLTHGLFGFLTGWRRFLSTVPAIVGGMFLAWATINFTDSPGVVITGQAEAEGVDFRDANTLDLVSNVRRARACPAQSQRYVWRWTVYKGKRAQQIIPLMGTDVPFLPEAEVTIVTIPSSIVPDKDAVGPDGKPVWFERTNISEQCSFLPTWMGRFFGGRVIPGPDIPVNFTGAPHK